MVLSRGEFIGLTVESAIDNQRQLAKFESKENERCSRDPWWEKSKVRLPGMIMAAGYREPSASTVDRISERTRLTL